MPCRLRRHTVFISQTSGEAKIAQSSQIEKPSVQTDKPTRLFLLKGLSGPLILIVLKWNNFFFLLYFYHHKWLVVSEDQSVEELETLPASTKPRTSSRGSAGGGRRRKRKCSTIFLERTREGHRQSDPHWNGCTGNSRETFTKRVGRILSLIHI